MVRTGASRVRLRSSYGVTRAPSTKSYRRGSVSVNSASDSQAGGSPARPAMPDSKSFLHQAENGPAILINHFHPCHRAHLRKVDSPETHSSDEDVYPVAQGLVF